MNTTKTTMLLAGMTGLFLAAGFLIGGQQGMIIAFAVAVAMNVFAWWNSGSMVLRLYGAKQVSQETAPQFHGLVAELAARANLPMPKVYIIENDQPNAFATGRNPENAAVAATTGLLRMLTREEIAGVMAHELAHVRNRDTLIMTVTATLAGAISMLANMAMWASAFGGNRNGPLGALGAILVAILAPMGAMLVQMAISRTREYEADRIGAEICGNPLWLASALEKLEMGSQRIDNNAAERNPATAHMFIVNPLHTQRHDKLFSTHPATANRVRALHQMAAELGMGAPAAPRGPWGR